MNSTSHGRSHPSQVSRFEDDRTSYPGSMQASVLCAPTTEVAHAPPRETPGAELSAHRRGASGIVRSQISGRAESGRELHGESGRRLGPIDTVATP